MNETIITKNVFEKSISKRLEWDVNVPDSKKDVLKILKSSTECMITDISFMPNSCNITLEAISDIIYIPENAAEENICSLKTKEIFSLKTDIPADISWEYEDVDIKCINEPCVLINSRKLGIRSNAVITLSLYNNSDFLCPQKTDDVILDTKTVLNTCIHSVTSEKIGISPVFTLPSGKPGIREVIKCNIKLLNKELKPITNKAVFKGNMAINLFYLSDVDTFECAEFASPFTEIIDINGLTDEMNLIYNSEVKKIHIEPIISDGNSAKSISAEGIIEIKIKAYTNCESPYVKDAYSPLYKEETEKENMNYIYLSENICDTYSLKEILEFEDTQIAEVYYIDADVITRNAELKDGKIMITASLNCDVFFRTQSGIRCENKNINFDFSQVIPLCEYTDDEVNIDIMCEPQNLSFVIAGNNMLEIRCSILFNSHLSKKGEINVIKAVHTDKKSPKKLSRAPVVAYFPLSDEPVFSVAKKYLSTPEKICSLNSISDDICKKGSCIIIE